MFHFYIYVKIFSWESRKTQKLVDGASDEELVNADIILKISKSELPSDEDLDEDFGNDVIGRNLKSKFNNFVPNLQTHSDSLSNNSNEENFAKRTGSKRAKMSKKIAWHKKVPNFNIISSKPPPITSNISVENELQLLKLFFTDSIVDYIVLQSNRYSESKKTLLEMTPFELWVLIGALLLSGYAKYPDKRMFWSKESDTPSILSNAISWSRFEQILHFIQVSDHSSFDPTDCLYKVRPFLNHVSDKFLELYPLEENLSIGESIIPYFGNHVGKQHVKGKPVRLGYKNRALCASNGYMYSFDLYKGNSESDLQDRKEFDDGGEIVKNLIAKANVPKNAGFKLYFDDRFTSYNLLKRLSEIGICAISSIREDQMLNCPLPNKNIFDHKPRGSIEFASTNCVMVIKYKDDNVWTIASNFHVSEPNQVKWELKKSEGTTFSQPPLAMRNYNNFVGGVDRMNHLVSCYRTKMDHKKWWWPIFLYFFDVTIVNAWLLWKKAKRQISLLEFRRNLAMTILKSYRSESIFSRRKIKRKIKRELRFDGSNHWLQVSKQRRCAFCPGKTTFSCTKCDVGLHPKCHKGFHTAF